MKFQYMKLSMDEHWTYYILYKFIKCDSDYIYIYNILLNVQTKYEAKRQNEQNKTIGQFLYLNK